jgi:flagella basal body P-ring formation protein FlgA
MPLVLLLLVLVGGLSAQNAPADLAVAAERVLRQTLELQPADQVVIGKMPSVSLPPGTRVEFSIEPGQPHQGRIPMQGVVLQDTRRLSRFEFEARVSLTRVAYVMKNAKNRGEPILREEVMTVERQVDYADGSLTTDTPVDGLETASYLAPGTLLTERNTQPVPDVRKGDIVTVEVINGRVRLETEAIAREDGRIGQRIICRNPTSGEVFRAEIRAKNTVLVDLEEK